MESKRSHSGDNEQSPQIANVQFKYEGPSVDDGSFDTAELGSILLATSSLFREANSLFNDSNVQLIVRTKAFNKGSFEVSQELTLLMGPAIGLLAGTSATALANLLQILGFTKDIGILQLLTFSKNRQPEQFKSTTSTKLKFGEDEIEVPNEVAAQFITNGIKIKKSLEIVINPLRKPGIHSLRISSSNEDCAIINKSDIEAFHSELDDSIGEKKENTSIAFLELHTCRFTKSPNWSFFYNGRVIHADIKDKIFLKRVIERKQRFGTNDLLKVELTEIIEPRSGELKSRFEIRKVIKVIAGSRQESLFPKPKLNKHRK